MEKILTEKDIELLSTLIKIVREETKKSSLSYSILSGILSFFQQEVGEKPKRTFAGGKWKWTEERKKEQRKRIKRFWKNRKKMVKEDGRKSIWTAERRRKLSKKIKKIWKVRKTHQHKRKRKIWNAQEEKFIRRELKEGTTQRKIAEKLNVGIPILKHRIRKLRGKE